MGNGPRLARAIEARWAPRCIGCHSVRENSSMVAVSSVDALGAETRAGKGPEARKNTKKVGTAPGLPGRSPIPVLFWPMGAYLRSSDGIRSSSPGMIVPRKRRSMACTHRQREQYARQSRNNHPGQKKKKKKKKNS
jgi:hypothetical protein